MIFNINVGVVIYFDKDLQFVFFLKKENINIKNFVIC